MFGSKQIDEEIVDMINTINRSLEKSGTHIPARYEVQVVHVLEIVKKQETYKLQIMRLENDRKQHTGAIQIIAQYEWMCRTDGRNSNSIINTFLAAMSMGEHNEFVYTQKGFCRLLVNLLVYCAACARRDLYIDAIHIGTRKCYRLYDDYSVDITKVGKDENRCIHLGPSDRNNTWGTEPIYHKDDNERMTRDAFVAMVKAFASREIMKILKLMDSENNIRLAMNPYVVRSM